MATIKNHLSDTIIEQNHQTEDYSLKVISGDGTKNVTIRTVRGRWSAGCGARCQRETASVPDQHRCEPMTHTWQYAVHEGQFAAWKDHPQVCNRLVTKPAHEPRVEAAAEPIPNLVVSSICGAKVQVREWDSHDGAYTDYQYRCANGHTWWIDGCDS